jgi:hypothetical protein
VPEHCESNTFTIEEKIQLVFELFNKQYQSLLVDVYEGFEKYLKIAYKELVIKDPSLAFKNNYFKAIPFIKRLHAKIPQIEKVITIRSDTDSTFEDVNMTLFIICLIEALRHRIVHNHGMCNDKTMMLENCIKAVGIFNNGIHQEIYHDEFNTYFGIASQSNRICLLEVYDKSTSITPFNSFIDRLGNLSGKLISYTKFINGYILRELKCQTSSTPPSHHTE